MRRFFLLLLLPCLLAACATPASTPAPASISTPAPASTVPPEQDPYFRSSGGGEPRSPGYWLLWNTCAEGNQSETARANGGREAGWIVMDDLLSDPGVLIGDLLVETCQQGLDLLQARDLAGQERQNDPAYTLAQGLLAAQLNQAAGAETCPAADQALSAAHLLLSGLAFSGQGAYLGPPQATPDRDTALFLTEQLSQYNSGALCLP